MAEAGMPKPCGLSPLGMTSGYIYPSFVVAPCIEHYTRVEYQTKRSFQDYRSPIGSLASVSRGIILDGRSLPLTTDYNQDVQRSAMEGYACLLGASNEHDES